jgi:palmitoyltransferase ZDHHC2/15/20
LKLDHFCLWVVNSVGLLNYKYFLLFLIYTTAACIETFVALLPVAIHAISQNKATSRCDAVPDCIFLRS